MVAGAAIYRDLCSACHAEDGTGVSYLIPNLAVASSVSAREPTSLLRVVIHGAQSVGTASEPTAPAMPAFGWQLTDAQMPPSQPTFATVGETPRPPSQQGEVHKSRSLQSGSGAQAAAVGR